MLWNVLWYQRKVPWLSVAVCTKGEWMVLPYWKKVVCRALNGLYGSGENMRTETHRQNAWVCYVPKILQLQEKVAYIRLTRFPRSVHLVCCNRMHYSFLLWKIIYKVRKEALMKMIVNTGMIAPFWGWLWDGRKICACGEPLWVRFLCPVLSGVWSKCSPHVWPVRHLTLTWCSFQSWHSTLQGAHVQCLRYLNASASAKFHSCFQM